MAENTQNQDVQVIENTPTPSEFLNLVLRGKPLNIGGNIVQYKKDEYTVMDSGGNCVFRRIPNAMSFWELCQFIGLEKENI